MKLSYLTIATMFDMGDNASKSIIQWIEKNNNFSSKISDIHWKNGYFSLTLNNKLVIDVK